MSRTHSLSPTQATHDPPAGTRVLIRLLMLTLICALLPASSCHHSGRRNHNHNDHHLGSSATSTHGQPAGSFPPQDDPYRLRHYKALPPPEGTQGIPTLLGIQGIMLPAAGPLGPDPRELASFTEHVLEANPELFTLPPTRGRLVFLGARRGPGGITVQWIRAAPRGQEGEQAIMGQGLSFRFDGEGRLRTILSSVNGGTTSDR